MENLDTTATFLESEEVHFEQNKEEHFLRFQFIGDDFSWTVIFQDLPDAQQIVVLSIAPSLVPENCRTEVGEFIHRVNFGMLVGNFEIDLDEGEVRFRTSMDTDDLKVDQNMIRNIIYGNIATMNTFMTPLHKVIFGGISPIEAIKSLDDEA